MSEFLSIEECRKYLQDDKLTDEQVKEIRDTLCVFVENALDNYFEECSKIKS